MGTPPKPDALMQVYEAVVRHVDWEVVKCLVIAGPGFTKDSFKTFLDAEAVRQDYRFVHAFQSASHAPALLAMTLRIHCSAKAAHERVGLGQLC